MRIRLVLGASRPCPALPTGSRYAPETDRTSGYGPMRMAAPFIRRTADEAMKEATSDPQRIAWAR